MKNKFSVIMSFIILMFLYSICFSKEYSIKEVITKISPAVEKELKPFFDKAKIEFPPKKMTFIALKKEKILELWAENKESKNIFIKSYKIQAASGESGPKLKQGDYQVPEGIYNIIQLNPNGRFYLTMLIDYPNKFDKEKAKSEKRTNLGGDICIHGKAASIGCLAMGDKQIEELFYMVVKTGMKNVKVIISPFDFRNNDEKDMPGEIRKDIKWLPELYSKIKRELKNYINKKTSKNM